MQENKYRFKYKDREEFLEIRNKLKGRGFVGGSDIGCITGVNQFKSNLELWYEYLGHKPEFVYTPSIIAGMELEGVISNLFDYWEEGKYEENYVAGIKPNKSLDIKEVVLSEIYPIFSTIDRFIITYQNNIKEGVLEIKNLSSLFTRMYKTGIPPSYYDQIQSYLLTLNLDFGVLCILEDGRHLNVFEIPADEKRQGEIIHAVEDFHARVAEAKTRLNGMETLSEIMNKVHDLEPEPAGEKYEEFMKDIPRLEEMQGNDALYDLAKRYKRYEALTKECTKRKGLAKSEIILDMTHNNANSITFGDMGRINYKKRFTVNLND